MGNAHKLEGYGPLAVQSAQGCNYLLALYLTESVHLINSQSWFLIDFGHNVTEKIKSNLKKHLEKPHRVKNCYRFGKSQEVNFSELSKMV